MDVNAAAASPHPGLSFPQFVTLVALLSATNALAIDSMLPALGQIGSALGIVHPNARQWVITSYLLGFGGAQIFYGTLADRYGRRRVLLAALAIYVVAALACALAHRFGLMMAARVAMGLGAAGTRVLATAIVRDCYVGRLMARVMSLSLLIFLAVPILAPSLGQLVMLVLPWRAIFLLLGLYGAAVFTWAALKLPETLHVEDRTPIRPELIARSMTLTLTNRYSLGYTLASTLITGALFGYINSSQQIFAQDFREPKLFTLIFAAVAGAIAAASIVNARLVARLGSRLLGHAAVLGFIAVAAVHAVWALSGRDTLISFSVLQAMQMFCFGLMAGNFAAMAMEPMGHIAGTASAVQGCITNAFGALLGFLLGQSFNGSTAPLAAGTAVLSLVSLGCVLGAERFRLFRPAIAA